MFHFISARSENSKQTIFDDDIYNMINEMYKHICILTVIVMSSVSCLLKKF